MFLGMIGALIIGISLGLLGSGGSILTVPILVYLLNEPEKLAIAEALFIVAIISFIGAITYAIRNQVDWRTVLFFGVPGMFGAYLGAYTSAYLNGDFQMILFGSFMIAAGTKLFLYPLIKKVLNKTNDVEQSEERVERRPNSEQSDSINIVIGFIVGFLTGLLGIGGGLFIVPALIFFNKFPISLAVGTSLTMIVMNSIVGFLKQLSIMSELNLAVNWNVMSLISLVGAMGSLIGSYSSNIISQSALNKFFGLILLLIGLYTFIDNLA